ncbi:MAG TPA: hypothetical protein VMR74_16375 [Gammaproteobacteria bacterium]|nr:hypothetical protein [Gammaproteobacteria bacterium]
MQNRGPIIALVSCALALIGSSAALAQQTSVDTTLNGLIEMPVPRGLSSAERSTWAEQTRWLTSVRNRYRELSISYAAPISNSAGQDAAAPTVPGGAVVSAAVSGLGTMKNADEPSERGERARVAPPTSAPARVNQSNDRLIELQQAVQNESRRFQTLSNALKARHDAAMNTIRNMK